MKFSSGVDGQHIFEPLSENQRLSLESMLKLLGRHAEAMGEILEE